MAALQSWIAEIKTTFSMPLFSLGRGEITVLTLIYLLVFTVLLFYLTGRLRHWMVEDLLTKPGWTWARASRWGPSAATSSSPSASSSCCRPPGSTSPP